MADQLPPPVVTITDPSRPGVPRDVVGDDRPVRTLSRQQKRVGWGLLALAALTTAAVRGLAWHQHEELLDRQSARDVSLSLFATVDSGAPGTLMLLSGGPRPVTVLSVGFDLPHLPVLSTAHVRVPRAVPTSVPLVAPASCPADVAGTPSHVVVRVRTSRGAEVTRRLVLPTDDVATQELVARMLATCGRPTAADSVRVSHRLVGDLRIRITLRNTSPVPRRVEEDSGGGGISFLFANTLTSPRLLAPGEQRVYDLDGIPDDCTTARRTWAPGAAGGLAMHVTGGSDLLYLPFDDPRVDAAVRALCADQDVQFYGVTAHS